MLTDACAKVGAELVMGCVKFPLERGAEDIVELVRFTLPVILPLNSESFYELILNSSFNMITSRGG